MRAAAEEYEWNLNYGGIAMMWRGGCIIRSQFLGKIKEAFDRRPDLVNLLLDPYFKSAVRKAQSAWRRTITKAVKMGIPVPAFSSALAYYDGYRRERLPANLLQAQRDYFGAHTYERDGQAARPVLPHQLDRHRRRHHGQHVQPRPPRQETESKTCWCNVNELKKLLSLEVYPASITRPGGTTYFLARRGHEKLVGCVGKGAITGPQGRLSGRARTCCVGPTDHANAVAIRQALPWTAPRCMGLATSVGLGDRLGLATPGHIRAIRGTGDGLKPFFAQQSIREMTRTQRTPEQVMDCATWGVLQEGFRDGFGSDADHVQRMEDIDGVAAVGFTMFTIDPGPHVVNEADAMGAADLAKHYAATGLEDPGQLAQTHLKKAYAGKKFKLAGGTSIGFDEEAFLRAAVKYGAAIAHVAKMHRKLQPLCKRPFELEVSVDETESVTTPAEHYFFAAELKRLGVKWVSMAPRLVGRFEKGVDYIGDLDVFRKSFAQHVAVMRTLGPYKISIHSGSDKFSIYPHRRRADRRPGAPQDGRHELPGGRAGDQPASTRVCSARSTPSPAPATRRTRPATTSRPTWPRSRRSASSATSSSRRRWTTSTRGRCCT